MPNKSLMIVVGGAVLLSGCSSRPRQFEPMLAAAPADQAAYDQKLQSCRVEIAGRMDKSGRLASAAGGAALGVGAGYAAGAATVAGSSAGIGGAAAAGAAAAAALMVLPVAGLAGAWGISKIKKSKKERAIKAAMAECLARDGYAVDKWRALSKREARALASANETGATSPGPVPTTELQHPKRR